MKKTLTFQSVRGKVSSPGLELPVRFLMDSDAEVLRSLLLPASLAFFTKISLGGKFVADFCLPQYASSPALQAHSQALGWNLAAFSPAWVKPSTEAWLGMSWRWHKVSHQFVLLLSVWAGYLPTQVTIVCRPLQFEQGGVEWQSKAGITLKSPQ